MAPAVENIKEGECGMKSVRLNIGKADAEQIASCIKSIAGNVSESDIVEIVLKKPEPVKKEHQGTTMTSREVAEHLGKGHSVIFKRIAKFICAEATEEEKQEFQLTSFKIPQGIEYPMYEMTEKACNMYCEWMKSYKNYKTMADGVDRLEMAIRERFHSERKQVPAQQSEFLLEGKPRNEYQEYCEMFNQFITGPAVEGREIAELTEKYEKFHEVMKGSQLRAKESNDIEAAVYGVAIEAEMQGFIYGFKMFDALMNKRLEVAV